MSLTNSRGQTSPVWLMVPVVVAWLATTWTEFDLALVLLAACAYFVLLRLRERAEPPTFGATVGVLLAGLVTIGFDFLLSRLAVLEAGPAAMIHIVGVVVLTSVFLLICAGARRAAVVVVLLYSLASGAFFITVIDPPAIDVWRAHDGATKLLLEGGNPYVDLNITLQAGSIEGRLFQYFYPPVTLGWYSLWTFLLGDPRWGSLMAFWIGLVVGSVAALWSPHRDMGIAIIAFVAIQPGWFLLMTGSFTEPLSATLFVVSLATFARHPTMSAVTMGLALASKQHLMLALPAIAIGWWRVDRTRVITTGATAASVYLLGFLFGPLDFLDAMFGPTLAAPNPDGVNLYAIGALFGLDLLIPQWLIALLAIAFGVLMSIRFGCRMWPSDHTAAVLSVFLFLLPYSIWSHWMLVTMLVTVSTFIACTRALGPVDNSNRSSLLILEQQSRHQSR